jgi:hypothetical protein
VLRIGSSSRSSSAVVATLGLPLAENGLRFRHKPQLHVCDSNHAQAWVNAAIQPDYVTSFSKQEALS